MIWFFLVLVSLVAIGEGILLVRAAKRLLQFDEIFGNVLPLLEEYGADLDKMSKGELLIDNPEVLEFHKKNRAAVETVKLIVDRVTSVAPPGRQKKKKAIGPRPKVI